MKLPMFQTVIRELSMLQTQWKSLLDPVLSNPATNPTILKDIALKSGSNTINHKLQQPLQGWSIVRQRAAASIYDAQDSNTQPALTLILVSSAPVVVDLLVF